MKCRKYLLHCSGCMYRKITIIAICMQVATAVTICDARSTFCITPDVQFHISRKQTCSFLLSCLLLHLKRNTFFFFFTNTGIIPASSPNLCSTVNITMCAFRHEAVCKLHEAKQ